MQWSNSKTRRKAAEWAKLIAAWEKSGVALEEFARRRKVDAKRITWWRWYLRTKKSKQERADAPAVKLVRLDVQPEPASQVRIECDGWEVATERGRLCVRGRLGAGELGAVLDALVAGRRPAR